MLVSSMFFSTKSQHSEYKVIVRTPQVQEPAAQPQLEQVQEVFPQPPAIVICLIWLIEGLRGALELLLKSL